MKIKQLPILKYYDTDNRLRIWFVEVEENHYRVTSGLDTGKK